MIEIRALTTHAEFVEAVDLQRRVWQFADLELLPVRLFVVATKVGGQVFGAFDGARMIGFCIAIPGLKPGGVHYLHSHMLGVLPEYRNAGVGRRMKLLQREEALSRSIQLVEWTFDPLEFKNAWFNLERLGAVVRRYVLNQYGITTSRLHSGLPTDRCVAEWWLASRRVSSLLDGQPMPRPPIEARVRVPLAVETLRHDNLREALEIQKSVSGQFLKHFQDGLLVTGIELDSESAHYLFSRDNPEVGL